MKWSASDHEYMAHALRLAVQGLYSCQPNPRVGCVIVNQGRIVGEGSHLRAGLEHAEIAALKQAGSAAKGASCYVTLEPCVFTGRTPPCTDALVGAGIDRVIAAMVDPNPRVDGRGLASLKEKGMETFCGLLENAARDLNKGFVKRMRHDMPYVRCKLAASLDGRTALNSGVSKWITGEAARADVQRYRAASCAVMTGIGTIMADDPALTVRGIETRDRQPARVVIDRRLRISPQAKLLQQPGKVVIFTHSDDAERIRPLADRGILVVTLDSGPGFLHDCLSYLASRLEINELLVEAGAGLSGALIEAGLVDELVLYQAPVVLGDKASGLFNMSEIKEMADKKSVSLLDIRHIGNDIRMIYEFNP